MKFTITCIANLLRSCQKFQQIWKANMTAFWTIFFDFAIVSRSFHLHKEKNRIWWRLYCPFNSSHPLFFWHKFALALWSPKHIAFVLADITNEFQSLKLRNYNWFWKHRILWMVNDLNEIFSLEIFFAVHRWQRVCFFFLTNALFISYVFPAVIGHKPNLCKSRVNTVVIHGQGMLSRIFNNEGYLFLQWRTTKIRLWACFVLL